VGTWRTENALIEPDEAQVEDIEEVFFARNVAHKARDLPLIVVEGVADARILQPIGALREEGAVYQIKELVALVVGGELQIEHSLPNRTLVVGKRRKGDVWREWQLVAMVEDQIWRAAGDRFVGIDFRLQQTECGGQSEIVDRLANDLEVSAHHM